MSHEEYKIEVKVELNVYFSEFVFGYNFLNLCLDS